MSEGTEARQNIREALDEFLGYFMIRKVAASDALLRAAGTVTKRLARWLGERDLLDEDAVEMVVEEGAEAGRELPRAARLTDLLYEQSLKSNIDVHALDDEDYLDDYLFIERLYEEEKPEGLLLAGETEKAQRGK